MSGIIANFRREPGDEANMTVGKEGSISAYRVVTLAPDQLLELSHLLMGIALDRMRVALADDRSPLPTEPGFYVGDYLESPSGKILIELLGTGQWVDNTDSTYLKEEWVAALGNLTRLVPEPVDVAIGDVS